LFTKKTTPALTHVAARQALYSHRQLQVLQQLDALRTLVSAHADQARAGAYPWSALVALGHSPMQVATTLQAVQERLER